MSILKTISLVILIIFYLVAGINHFRNPGSYLRIIPNYFPYKVTINLVSGFFEIAFALMLIFPQTRPYAAWGIIFLLVAFLPVHITMIGDAPLRLGKFTVTPLIAWVRLIILQPLLILWAWWYVK